MGKAQYGLNGKDRENFRAIRKETTSSLPKGLPVVATNGKNERDTVAQPIVLPVSRTNAPPSLEITEQKKVRAGCHRSDRPEGEVMLYLCRRPCISTGIG